MGENKTFEEELVEELVERFIQEEIKKIIFMLPKIKKELPSILGKIKQDAN